VEEFYSSPGPLVEKVVWSQPIPASFLRIAKARYGTEKCCGTAISGVTGSVLHSGSGFDSGSGFSSGSGFRLRFGSNIYRNGIQKSKFKNGITAFLEKMLLLSLKMQDFVQFFGKNPNNGLDPVPEFYPEPETEPELFQNRNRNRNRNKSFRFHNTAP